MFRSKNTHQKEKGSPNSKSQAANSKSRGGRRQRSAQNAIYYEALTESGLAYLSAKRYSATLLLSDIDYALTPAATQEGLVEKYAAFLNGHLAGQHLQITVLNRVLDKADLLDEVALSPRGDGWDYARSEYNRLISSRLETGRNNTLTQRYLTITIEADSFDEAQVMLNRIISEDASTLREVGGCKARLLTGAERIKVLQQLLRPGVRPDFDYGYLAGQKLTTKDFVCPWAIDDTRDKDYVELWSGGQRRLWQTLVLRQLPPWISDRLINELSTIPSDLTLSIHLDPIDQAEGLKMVKRQIAGMDIQRVSEQRKLAKQGLSEDLMPHELRASHEEAVQLRHQLETSNEKLFQTTIVIGIAAENSSELKELSSRVLRLAAKHSCRLEILRYMQMDGLNAILPLGVCRLPIKRTITTAVGAVLIPFTSQEIFDSGGNFYGVNALSKNLIVADRTQTMNSNGFILGTSGSGKSQFAKFEIEQIFLRRAHDEILIIDPEREYAALCQELSGTRVVISPGSPHCINPLALDKDMSAESNPLRDKCAYVLSLIEVLIGGASGLSAQKRSLIDRCAQGLYSTYWNTDEATPPTLLSLHDELATQDFDEARELATGLELYAKGSASAFARQTNVDLSNRLTVFDTADLGSELQTFGMMVVLETIWQKIVRNKARGVRTWVYIDEFHLLFSHAYSSSYCQALFKRVRKYGASATGITQNIEELLASESARLMLSNSDGLFLLNQQSTDADTLTDLLELSAQQRSYFVNASPGCGLLRVGESTVPFDNTMDPHSRLFKLFSTRFADRNDTVEVGSDGH
ncbi:VirB4-like conjugal transfer ATPase, CD1110 family [Trueperella sp. LYQ143]|uniref:VirB4-like conjugal transfer ATPase, CD1110 family n=1 Tax=Trueperella sp. LYQ143 TaxID=3391059 RepID=UPI003983CF88